MSDVKFISSKQKQVEKQKNELPTRDARNTKQFADTYTPAYALGAAPRTTYYWMDNRTPCEDEVVQRQRINVEKIDEEAGTGVDLPKSQWPTMVYESMGTSLRQCLSVYKESQKYPGNSICIFGLNVQKEEGEQGGPEKKQGEPGKKQGKPEKKQGKPGKKQGKPGKEQGELGKEQGETDYDKNRDILSRYQKDIEHGIDEKFLAAAEKNDDSGLQKWIKPSEAIPGSNAEPLNIQQPYHLLYTCSFTWKKPDGSDKGYDMPFVEARLLLMNNAAKIVENVKAKKNEMNGQSSQSETDKGHSYKFLYRWIDGDATDDTTYKLRLDKLREMADNDAIQIVTGRYDWRHQDPETGKRAKYHQFIERINESEKMLRDYYYELADRSKNNFEKNFLEQQLPGRTLVLSAEQRRFPLTTARVMNAPQKNHYLPGYYLPETTMLMNKSAHNLVSNIYFPQIDFGEGSQDKESMKIMHMIFEKSGNEEKLPANTVIYQSELSVKKPLKHEFQGNSYLGRAMLDFIKEEKEDIGDFAKALKKIRQSAWGDQWYFVNENGWNDWEKAQKPTNEEENRQELFNCKRRMLMHKLWYGFFEGNRKEIYKELDAKLKAYNASQ